MRNGCRFSFVSLAALLSATAFALFIVLFIQGSSPDRLSGVYYLEMDLRNVSRDVAGKLGDYIDEIEKTTGLNLEPTVVEALDLAKKAANMRDGYRIGLTNYCAGSYNDDDELQLDFCSEKDLHFYFDPITVWKLNETGIDADKVLPSEVHTALDLYKTLSRYSIIFHIVAAVCCFAAFLFAFIAQITRLGSVLIAVVGLVSMLLSVAGAGIVTGCYAAITAVFKAQLEPYGAYASLGNTGLALDWAAAALSILAFFIWVLTSCCCKPEKKNKYKYTAAPAEYHKEGGSYQSTHNQGHQYQSAPTNPHYGS